jgi:hypothetical protein
MSIVSFVGHVCLIIPPTLRGSGNARTYGHANTPMADDATGLLGRKAFTLADAEIDPASPSRSCASTAN